MIAGNVALPQQCCNTILDQIETVVPIPSWIRSLAMTGCEVIQDGGEVCDTVCPALATVQEACEQVCNDAMKTDFSCTAYQNAVSQIRGNFKILTL